MLARLIKNTSRLTDMDDKVTTSSLEVSSVKADEGSLHVTTNNVQSKQLEVGNKTLAADNGNQQVSLPSEPSAAGGKVGALLNAATHKPHFPK
jgi:hypothetical protein